MLFKVFVKIVMEVLYILYTETTFC